MNYQSSQSFHTLTHWQSGRRIKQDDCPNIVEYGHKVYRTAFSYAANADCNSFDPHDRVMKQGWTAQSGNNVFWACVWEPMLFEADPVTVETDEPVKEPQNYKWASTGTMSDPMKPRYINLTNTGTEHVGFDAAVSDEQTLVNAKSITDGTLKLYIRQLIVTWGYLNKSRVDTNDSAKKQYNEVMGLFKGCVADDDPLITSMSTGEDYLSGIDPIVNLAKKAGIDYWMVPHVKGVFSGIPKINNWGYGEIYGEEFRDWDKPATQLFQPHGQYQMPVSDGLNDTKPQWKFNGIGMYGNWKDRCSSYQYDGTHLVYVPAIVQSKNHTNVFGIGGPTTYSSSKQLTNILSTEIEYRNGYFDEMLGVFRNFVCYQVYKMEPVDAFDFIRVKG